MGGQSPMFFRLVRRHLLRLLVATWAVWVRRCWRQSPHEPLFRSAGLFPGAHVVGDHVPIGEVVESPFERLSAPSHQLLDRTSGLLPWAVHEDVQNRLLCPVRLLSR